MDRILTNRCRSRKKYIALMISLFSLLVLFQNKNIDHSEITWILENAVALSQRGISLNFKDEITVSRNHSELEIKRSKSINRTGVLSSLKPGVPGFVNMHMWFNLCGDDILTLKLFPLFPNVPSKRQHLTSLHVSSRASSYGKRLFGYVIVPMSANYSFRLKYSGTVEFWLSEDQKPENCRCLLCEHVSNVARTAEIHLQQSKSYYFEILHQHGGYQIYDNLLLQWKINNSDYTRISEKYLHSYQDDRGVDEDVVNVESFPLSGLEIHRKDKQLKSDISHRISRENIYKLPFIEENLVKELFPYCKYEPGYVVTARLKRFSSQWETFYPQIYPVDYTNSTDKRGMVSFGNDVLQENLVFDIVKMVMSRFKIRQLRQFQLENIINVEEKRGRFLVELQLLDKNTQKSVRFSEYLIFKNNDLCYPEGFNWNKTSMVNFVVTAGRNQGRWVYHFILNMEKIYKETKDKNFNVIINDFLCPDADIRKALENSSLPNYIYLTNPGRFHKTLGLQQAADKVTDGIIAILDLHLDIPSYYVDDIRKHTIRGYQIFSPILQRYECGTNSAVNMGSFWEFQGYGLVGAYKRDWDKFGGMNVEEFKYKWGGEDVEMNDRVLMAGFENYRKKIKGMVHYYHSKSGMWNLP